WSGYGCPHWRGGDRIGGHRRRRDVERRRREAPGGPGAGAGAPGTGSRRSTRPRHGDTRSRFSPGGARIAMALEKLTIVPERGESITALFNPERYTLNKATQYAEINIPGLDQPVVQFVRGQSKKITLDLFFDTTESGMVDDVKDVRTLTGKV